VAIREVYLATPFGSQISNYGNYMINEERTVELKQLYKSVLGGDFNKIMGEGYKPRADVSPISIKHPFVWKHKDRNVEFSIHAWRFLNPFFSKYLDTLDFTYIELALEFIRSWSEYEASGAKNTFIWYDMATGLRAIALAFITEIVRDENIELSQVDVALLERLANKHIKNLSTQENVTTGNHAIYQILGLRLLSLAKSDETTLEYCEENIERLIAHSFDENYVNTENSPFYHDYNIGLLRQLRGELFPHETKKINNILNNGNAISGWLSDPTGAFFCIGDTEGMGKPIRGVGPFDKVSASVKHVHKDLHQSGYIVVRTHPRASHDENLALIFHATNRSHVHSHADHLSFILYSKGVELLTDSGKYTYNYDAWRDYFVSDRAHNVVGLSDITFLPKDIALGAAKLNPIQCEPECYTLSGEVQKGDAFHFHRTLKYVPDAYIEIVDCVKNATESPIEVRFHLGIDIHCELESNELNLFKGNTLLGKLVPETPYKSITIEKGKGLNHKRIMGWVSKRYKEKIAIETICIEYPMDQKIIKTKLIL
jgi:hypothetical protein